MLRHTNYSLLLGLFLLLMSCDVYMHPPLKQRKARIGEQDKTKSAILKNIVPKEKIIVGVYKFRDQTGQYKSSETGSSWSTAVTQGATSILLKSLEDSKWFSPIERENVSNLLNERQIIRSTRKEYNEDKNPIPPLLFAGILLEGGIISYDSNIVTGGAGLRYFGVGGSSQYRQDRITIYLRAVSTSSGKILKTVYTSKTVLSQSISANLFRYVALKRLLEAETGVTKNEPVQLAVKAAIDKAVESLIAEGIIDGIWTPQGGERDVKLVKNRYEIEQNLAADRDLYDRRLEDKRGRSFLGLQLTANQIQGDYSGAKAQMGTGVSGGFFLNNPHLSVTIEAAYFGLKNEEAFEDNFLSLSSNLNYNFLPFDKLTPYVYGGVGGVSPSKNIDGYFKFQYGLGLEYLFTPEMGLKVFFEHNLLTTDELDKVVQGKRKDNYFRAGVQMNFYFGKKYKIINKD